MLLLEALLLLIALHRVGIDRPGGSVRGEQANLTGLVLGGGGGRPDYLQKLGAVRCGYRINHQKLMVPEVLFRT